jgi:hypothetical protein
MATGTGSVTLSSTALAGFILGSSSTTTVSWVTPTISSLGIGIQSINSLTAATQTLTTGTVGTGFGINSVGVTHTFNLPDASQTATGLMNTGVQQITGNKTFQNSVVINSVLNQLTLRETTLLSESVVPLTITLPNSSDTLVSRNSVDVLTNKSWTNPAITAVTTLPTNITANNVTLFTGFTVNPPTMSVLNISLTNKPFQYQSAMFSKKTGWWNAVAGSTTPQTISFGNSTTGTATARTPSSANALSSLRRIGYVSGAVAGSSSGTRYNGAAYWRGNGPNRGGFFYVCRFGITTAAPNIGNRMFIGLYATTAVIGNVNPSTLLNIIGFGSDTGDSNISFMVNGTGTTTKLSLGSLSVTNNTNPMEARIYCPPNSNSIQYSIKVFNGSYVTGAIDTLINTNVPSNTTFLSPQVWINNGTSAGRVAIDVINQYIETEY